MWTELLLNLAVLVAVGHFGSQIGQERSAQRPRARLIRVGVASLSAVLLLLLPGHVQRATPLDLGLVPLALVTFTYGPLWGGLAALPALVVRLLLNGPGLPLDLLGSVLALGLAALLGQRSGRRGVWWQPLVIFLPTPLPLLALPDAPELLRQAALPYFALQVFGYLTLARVYDARMGLLRLARDFQKQARTDSLTGLWNRRQFNEDLESLAVGDHLMLLDIDHFKKVNDTHGHDVGDEVLIRVAEVLASAHAPGRVYRLGGEEFALLLRRSTPEQARTAAELCWRAVRTRSYHATTRLHISCSVGVAARRADEDSQVLYQRADVALYRAKAAGRDRVVYGVEQETLPDSEPLPAAPATTVLRSQRGETSWHARWKAVLATLELVNADHELGPEDWERILQAAVYSVPGGEAGTLMVRDGEGFVLRAQLGFDDALIGLRQSERGLACWYGGSAEDHRAGRVRVLRGEEITKHSLASAEADLDSDQLYWTAGRVSELRSTVCAPVVVEDRVVAHLNIDSFSHSHAFQGPGREVAREFGVQIAALLRAAQDRRQAAARQHELEALMRVTAALRQARSEQDIAQALVNETSALLHGQRTIYLTYDRDSDSLRSGFWAGPRESEAEFVLPRGQGLSWLALTSGEVQHSPDPSADTRVYYHPSLARDPVLVVPLRSVQAEEIGVLVVRRAAADPITAQDQALARGISALAVTAIERARHLNALEAGREGAFQALGLALEARDFETQGHTRRVQRLGERFCHRLGLDTPRREAMSQGAYLHDIGKLQVPDRVLLKPARLDPEEWKLMQMHARWGFEIARRVPGIRPEALELILYHHERWDGGGYPSGLCGTEIPLLARAFSIIDSFDALTHARPYKPAWSVEDALAELKAQAGRQFDPQLVGLFCEIVREGPSRLDLLPPVAHADPDEAPLTEG